ncbi:MAG: formyltransferase family protein [Brumimicrobium sp.]
MRIGILTSGRLGYKVLSELHKQIDQSLLIATDGRSETVIEEAKKNQIPLFIGNPRNGALEEFIKQHQMELDLILSINYLFLLDDDLLGFLPLSINIHGSLLPKYRGRTPHVWAIINGETQTGVTAHIIDSGCDTGDVVKQQTVPIENYDTGAKILEKYEQLYPNLLLSVIKDMQSGKLQRKKQDDSKATTFGRRTPDHGLINWCWHKERIRNWVRAQAYPYPGAFTWLKGRKVVIDEVTYSEIGFSDTTENGTILQTGEIPIIKCPNGAIKLSTVRNKKIVKNFKNGLVLNQ